MNDVVFTMDGDDKALAVMRPLFEQMGNRVLQIDSDKKVLYHCSASLVSNFMIGLYQMGLDCMEDCGMAKEAAGEEDAQLYRLVGKKVLEVAKLRNPDENYEELETLL